MLIFFLSTNLLLISCHPATGVVEDVNLDELEDDPFLDNPRYKYSFNVADDEEQTYQRQAQQLEDRVRGLGVNPLKCNTLKQGLHFCCVWLWFECSFLPNAKIRSEIAFVQ